VNTPTYPAAPWNCRRKW